MHKFNEYLTKLSKSDTFEQWSDPNSSLFKRYATSEVLDDLGRMSTSYLPMYICTEFAEYLPAKACSSDLGIYNMETPLALIKTVLGRLHEV